MIYYNLPGFYDHYELNTRLLHFLVKYPWAFRNDVRIGSVFGNFDFCPWDGGRNFCFYEQVSKEKIESICEHYRKFGIPMRFIFTNPEIKEEHLSNRFCNLVLKLCDNGNNEVCVNSPILEKYIRENYPNYKIISSTTKRLNSPEALLKELDKNYYQVCLDYDLNKNMELLESIPKEKRNKCEFLVNAICNPGCPSRKLHYSYTGKAQLSWLKEKYVLPSCSITSDFTHPEMMLNKNNLTPDEIEQYAKMGYNHFKIEGRTVPSSQVLCMYLYYLIKPEWQYFILARMADEPDGIFVNGKTQPWKGEITYCESNDLIGSVSYNLQIEDPTNPYQHLK